MNNKDSRRLSGVHQRHHPLGPAETQTHDPPTDASPTVFNLDTGSYRSHCLERVEGCRAAVGSEHSDDRRSREKLGIVRIRRRCLWPPPSIRVRSGIGQEFSVA